MVERIYHIYRTKVRGRGVCILVSVVALERKPVLPCADMRVSVYKAGICGSALCVYITVGRRKVLQLRHIADSLDFIVFYKDKSVFVVFIRHSYDVRIVNVHIYPFVFLCLFASSSTSFMISPAIILSDAFAFTSKVLFFL